jgi:spore coat polysaccharide biosynthesis protein SpsF
VSTLAILQARMSSTRLPGKVLEPIEGMPLILRAIERISRARSLDGLVLATSTDPSDDPLAAVARDAGVEVRRGDLDDVLGRFLVVVEEFDPVDVVRLTGDNALTDPGIIDRVVAAHREHGTDYTSNTVTRTFPRGLDVEVVRADVLRALPALGLAADEREHVTLGVYRRPERFRVHQVTQADDRSDLRWTVDLPEDLAFARTVYGELLASHPGFGQDEILALLSRRPEISRTEADAAH